MYHMFDVTLAGEVGIVAAVLFQNIAFWCQHSRANDTNFHDGLYWTYNSVKALRKVFPYLSASQIDTGIKKLVDAGIVVKGNYNNSAYDRTTWYAVTEYGESIFEKSEMEKGKIQNGFGANREPIPDINTDKKPNTISRKRAQSEESPGFAEFWKQYPRKVAKQNAVKAWIKTGADDSQALTDTIIADVKRRVSGEWDGKDIQYVPHPATYLNQRRWEDEAAEKVEQDVRDLSLDEIMRRAEDTSVPEGFTPCGGW